MIEDTIPELPYNAIKRKRVNELLNKSYKRFKIIYVYGHMGWGKTVAVAMWAKDKKGIEWIRAKNDDSAFEEVLEELSLNARNSKKLIVIDDYYLLSEDKKTRLNQVVAESHNKYMLLSRCIAPVDLKMTGDIHVINADDLRFTKEETAAYFKENWHDLNDDDIEDACEIGRGWVATFPFIGEALKSRELKNNKEIRRKINEQIFEVFDYLVVNKWTEEEYEFLIKMGFFRRITAKMAEFITREENSGIILKRLVGKEVYIVNADDNTYSMNCLLREYLIRCRNKWLSPNDIIDIYISAGRYYELQNQLEKAIECYINADEFKLAEKLIMHKCNRNINIEELWRLRKYYEKVPMNLLKESPNLTLAMAILGLVKHKIKESKYWKENLLEIMKRYDSRDKVYGEAKENLFYLECITPSNGKNAFIELMNNPESLYLRIFKSPSNVTLSRPYVLNGALDLSGYWTYLKNNREKVRKCVEKLYGENGNGIIEVVHGETLYQQDKLTESMLKSVSAISKIDQEEYVRIIFAAMFLQVEIMIASGQLDSAKSILRNIEKRSTAANIPFLLANYKAIYVWICMFERKYKEVNLWMREEAPNELDDICCFDRFRYFVKMKAYLMQEKYILLLALAERLRPICEEYKFSMDLIEVELMTAIAYYRLEDYISSMKQLERALMLGQEYGYIRIFSDLGNAVYKIVYDYKEKYNENGKIKDSFLLKILQAAKKMAIMYPEYLSKEFNVEASRLTYTEKEVLTLMSQSKSNGDIAEFLGVSINTIKFHSKNIYQKLYVKNRGEAIKKAIELKLI